MLDTLILILTLLLKAASLWFLAVALFALRKPKRYAVCAPRTRFACLVAARNEEAVIGALVESLKKQDYPDALYDIFVIPNNCTDDTESEALCAGAKIFRCFEPVRCKGDALHEAFETLLRKDYDAFCVFDADNIADEQFLARMNDAFCAGAQVCKGAMRAKNPYDSWLSGCYGLYFTLFDTFFSRARMSCGLSSKLVGTGFAVHRAVLERFGGWNTSTIAEDAEFAAQCAANGVRVCFVPGALTYDEAPNDFAVSLRQRRRWCSGIMDVAVRMDAPLVSALRGSAPLRALDALLDYQDYPIPAAKRGAMGRRTLGIGVINFAYYLAKHGKRYSDGSANNLTHKTFEAIQYYLLKASNELAKEQGACPWFNETTYAKGILPIDTYKKDLDAIANEPLHYDWEALRESIKTHGLRNSTLSALMPSETSSQISNATNGIEPPRGYVSIKASKDGILRQVVPDYEHLHDAYELLWEMPGNDGYLQLVGIMQKFIDQSISANTNYDPSRFPSGKVPMQQLLKDLLTAYKFGVKTLYYQNTRDGAEDAQDDLVPSIQDDGCESGACKI